MQPGMPVEAPCACSWPLNIHFPGYPLLFNSILSVPCSAPANTSGAGVARGWCSRQGSEAPVHPPLQSALILHPEDPGPCAYPMIPKLISKLDAFCWIVGRPVNASRLCLSFPKGPKPGSFTKKNIYL